MKERKEQQELLMRQVFQEEGDEKLNNPTPFSTSPAPYN